MSAVFPLSLCLTQSGMLQTMPPVSFCHYNHSYLLDYSRFQLRRRRHHLCHRAWLESRGGVWGRALVLCSQWFPFPCPSCLLSFNNRAANKEPAFSLHHVMLALLQHLGQMTRPIVLHGWHTGALTEGSKEGKPKEARHASMESRGETRRRTKIAEGGQTETQSEDADPSFCHMQSEQRQCRGPALVTVRSVTGWRHVSWERKRIARVLEEPLVLFLQIKCFQIHLNSWSLSLRFSLLYCGTAAGRLLHMWVAVWNNR